MIPKRKYRQLLIVMVFITMNILSFVAPAQTISFRKYTVLDGLPENRIMGIREDSRGFLWLLSKNGISRFDGIEMIVYTESDGLPDNRVIAFIEDDDNDLWAFTSKGVAKYNGEGFTPFPYYTDSSVTTLNEFFKKGKGSTIYLKETDRLGDTIIILFSNGTYLPFQKNVDILRDKNIKDIYYHPEYNEIWLIIDNLLYSLNENQLLRLSDLQADNILYINGRLLVGSGDGYYEIKGKELFMIRPQNVSTGQLTSIIATRIDNSELTMYSPYSYSKIRWNDGWVNGVFEDSDGAQWIYSESGLYRILSWAFTNFTFREGVFNNVWSVVEDKNGDIMFGSVYKTLQKYDGVSITTINDYKLTRDGSFQLGSKTLSNGKTWFTTYDGILEWDGTDFTFLDLFEGQAEIIYENSENGDILIGAVENLLLIQNDEITKFREVSAGNLGFARSICNDTAGVYWLVTNKSILSFDGNSFIEFDTGEVPAHNFYSCERDSTGRLWFGGDNGLYYLSGETGTLIRALPADNNSPVRFIKVVDRNLLVAGRVNDMITIDLDRWQSGESYAVTNYNHLNGFLGLGCIQNGVTMDRNGHLWIASNDRVVRFDPSIVSANRKPPILHITSVDVMQNNYTWERKININIYNDSLNENIKLKHYENDLRINITGISTHNPEGVVYRYKLLPGGGEWSQESKTRYAELTGLQPGKYNLEIMAANAEGVWTSVPAMLNFEIEPAFWQTNGFRLGTLLTTIILIAFSTYLILRYINRKREQRIRYIREYYRMQMGSFVQQFDPHFTFNMVSSISYLIEAGNNTSAEKYIIGFAGLLRKVLSESDQITKTLEAELEFIGEYCALQKLVLKERFNYSIIIESGVDINIPVPRMVIHTFAENAIKWGISSKETGGDLTITVTHNKSTIISVKDNGIGRTAAAKRKLPGTGKGFTVTKSLIKTLNDYNREKMVLEIIDLYVENGEPEGTEVILAIPDQYNYFLPDQAPPILSGGIKNSLLS